MPTSLLSSTFASLPPSTGTPGTGINEVPTFPSLTPDDRIWRIDWFGDCAYPAAVRRYSQPSIKVVLSPLRGDVVDREALLLPEGTDLLQSREIWAPISALPILSIGDLWQHGRRIDSPDYQVETFKQLSIIPATASFVKAGLAIEEHFLLPLAAHPWHRQHTQSYCVAIALDERRRLLIPCIELIRFYFGSSSNLLQRLFTAPLRNEALWSSKHFNPDTRHLHLVLAHRLSGLSASDIGRIAASSYAWRAAAGIHSSCQKAAADRRPVYPYTGFPFEGCTELVVSGIWLPVGDLDNATFVALRLRSCSHPFPFRSLSYEAGDRRARYPARGTDSSGEKGHPAAGRSNARKAEAKDGDPDAKRPQRVASFVRQVRFPDLVRKQVWREKIEAMPQAKVLLRLADGSLQQVACGESDRAADVRGLDLRDGSGDESEARRSDVLPWFVQTGLKMIASDASLAPPGATVKVVCPEGRTEAVFSFPVVINEDGEIDSDLFFTGVDGRARQRRCCFVEVRLQGANPRILLIFEGRTREERPQVVQEGGTAISAA